MVGQNVGHGHVFPRPDGVRARCGGPALCSECSRDLARKQRASDDPRNADTLDQASLNHDGKTYNGARALAWLSDVLTGGKGLSEEEVADIFEKEKAKRAAGLRAK